MKFLVLDNVHGRTAGGHHHSVMEGNTCVVPDEDKELCALVREWATNGQVKILEEPKPASSRGAAKSKEDSK